ncbi:MAG TPA: LysM peptidoglycan-binding domain-containing protein, partial [Bacteroidetes bacterium]|nr:LysM peptidoglycan-binding domain-containing protein [Bacteroidota bacterium]
YQDREGSALEAIAQERAAIDDLHARIAEIEAQIKATWDEIYALLGATEADIKAFLEAIGKLENRVNQLARLSPDMLLDQTAELDGLGDEIKEMQSHPIALLSEPRERLSRLATRVEALKRSLPKPKHDIYHVLRGDYLWKISGRAEIFNDPWKWMRIYSANRDEIKDPDLIYPDQALRIPRQIGRDEHLVMRGDFLRKIAGYAQVYGDPFQWTKIYQANKTIIQDPNLIYPEQILIIPRN